MKAYETFSDAYRRLVVRLLDAGAAAPRGEMTRELVALQFSVERPADVDLHCAGRRWSAGYFAGELCWYLAGSSRLADIAPYSSFWARMSADGESVASAYGARLFRGQLDRVARLLASDAASRRAVLTLLHPSDDLDAPDVPCTVALQFLLRGDALHLVATMRSNDVWLGTAYDVPAFATFQSMLASRLGVAVGRYVHQAGSLHLYERDVAGAEAVVASADRPCAFLRGPTWDGHAVGALLEYEAAARTGAAPPRRPDLAGFWGDVAGAVEAFWLRRRARAAR